MRTVLAAAGLHVLDLDQELGATKSADLLVSLTAEDTPRHLVEIKGVGGTAPENLVRDLQRHLDTWPQLRPQQPVAGGVLIVNHQHKLGPSERSREVYTRRGFVDALQVTVLSARQLFDWWREEDWAAIRGHGVIPAGNSASEVANGRASSAAGAPASRKASRSANRSAADHAGGRGAGQPARRRGRPRGPDRVALNVRIRRELDDRLTAAVDQTGQGPRTWSSAPWSASSTASPAHSAAAATTGWGRVHSRRRTRPPARRRASAAARSFSSSSAFGIRATTSPPGESASRSGRWCAPSMARASSAGVAPLEASASAIASTADGPSFEPGSAQA